MPASNSAVIRWFRDLKLPDSGFDHFRNQAGEIDSSVKRLLIGAGVGATGGFGGRLALSRYFPDAQLGVFPELAGAVGGAYLAHTLSGGSDKKNSARLLYLDRIQAQ